MTSLRLWVILFTTALASSKLIILGSFFESFHMFLIVIKYVFSPITGIKGFHVQIVVINIIFFPWIKLEIGWLILIFFIISIQQLLEKVVENILLMYLRLTSTDVFFDLKWLIFLFYGFLNFLVKKCNLVRNQWSEDKLFEFTFFFYCKHTPPHQSHMIFIKPRKISIIEFLVTK